MKKYILIMAVILVFSTTTQAGESPRTRARAQEAKTYGDNWDLNRVNEHIAADFRDLQRDHQDVLRIGDLGLMGIELFYGGKKILFQYNQPVQAGGKVMKLVRYGLGAVLIVDGVARFALTLDGKDPTISPLVTYTMLQAGMIEAPGERNPPASQIYRCNVCTPHISHGDKIAFLYEVGFGLAGNSWTLAINPTSVAGKRWGKAVKIGSTIAIADGLLRLLGNTDHAAFPLLEFTGTKILQQPLVDKRTVGETLHIGGPVGPAN